MDGRTEERRTDREQTGRQQVQYPYSGTTYVVCRIRISVGNIISRIHTKYTVNPGILQQGVHWITELTSRNRKSLQRPARTMVIGTEYLNNTYKYTTEPKNCTSTIHINIRLRLYCNMW